MAVEQSSSAGNARQREVTALRQGITDLIQTFGTQYSQGAGYLDRLGKIEASFLAEDPVASAQFRRLRQEALLANPLLADRRLLLVKRRSRDDSPTARDRKFWYSRSPGLEYGFPSNHECNSSLPRDGYENELAILSPIAPGGALSALFRPTHGGYVGETDLHWDGDRLLFTRSDATNWTVWEMRVDGSGLRQVSRMPADVDCFDACYLPDGRIVFGSTASFQAVPCWHGQKLVSNLYLMNADGTGVRQLCFDQDHNFHPTVLPSGQVLYHRWDYTGINHIFLRQLMVMNPDGTGQRAIYGSSSWYPNALYFPRPLPGESGQIAAILSGYHGVHRMGQFVLLDTARGWQEAEGIVQRISGRGQAVDPKVRDILVDQDWPKFLHPLPISEKHFLVAGWMNATSRWAIYLADVFDNLVKIREEPGWALLEPVLLKRSLPPPVIPDRVDLTRTDGVVYLHNIHEGPGLAGVPRGVVKSLRVLAYHFGYRGLAGPDKIGLGGPWEVMRILGTVPLDEDGSAMFRVPANTPIAVQPLDAEGKAVQLMRSWFTVMPGETISCVGCHERPGNTPSLQLAAAARKTPLELTPWHGPARGFDFAREVQPVLDRQCASCHNGDPARRPDLRSAELATDYRGHRISQMGIDRLHPKIRKDTGGVFRYTPAYEALIHQVRRVGIEDDVSLLTPGEYHADISPLVQLLRKGHHGIRLDAEEWDRLVTWLDLNAPCHGTWGEVYPIPDGMHERRMALRKDCGGPGDDPERLAMTSDELRMTKHVQNAPVARSSAANQAPIDSSFIIRHSSLAGRPRERTIDLGNGIALKLVPIPAGEFAMGDPNGAEDELPRSRVTIPDAFWMAECEISNEQYRQFDSSHDPRYYARRHARSDDQGLPLNDPKQPVVRVSWNDAMAFCRWLSAKTGLRFSLPTEAQWEWACRAGSATPLSFGGYDADFSLHANLADASLSKGLVKDGKQITGGLEHLVLEGAALSDGRFNDGAVVTAEVGRRRPNAWGLRDMHGNAAEWTRSEYCPYPYRADDGRNDMKASERKVVRGGSFFDPPRRSGSGYRLAYPAWQRVFNVGFRVVCEGKEPGVAVNDRDP